MKTPNMIRKLLIITFCASLLTGPAVTQDQITHQPASTQQEIGDNTALCIFLQAVALYPTRTLPSIGLTPAENESIVQISVIFKARFVPLVNAYDAGHLTRDEFISSRETLLSMARTQLRLHLSPESLTRFLTYVTKAKERMNPEQSGPVV
jgi:hypothetical protein